MIKEFRALTFSSRHKTAVEEGRSHHDKELLELYYKKPERKEMLYMQS